MQSREKDMDLQLRSMLADAEEAVPQGVWEAISDRLPAAAVPVRHSWYGWAAGFAAAAALAAGLFFSGTFDNSDPIHIIDKDAPQAVAQLDAETEASSDQVPEAEATGTKAIPTYHHIPVTREAEDISAAVTETESIKEAEEECQVRESQPESRQEIKPKASSGTYAADPFASTPDEARSRRSKLAFTLNSTITGNDSEFASKAGISMGAGGSGSNGQGISEKSISSYSLPVSLGVGIRYQFNKRLSLGTGLEWTMLNRSFDGRYYDGKGGSIDGDVNHVMHYVGIPVNLYFSVINSRTIDFYAYAGGALEYCVSNRYHMYGQSPAINFNDPVRKLQPSLAIGLGVEFKLPSNMGIYIDPGMRYFFPQGQPKSIRTDRLFMLDFQVGLRFDL